MAETESTDLVRLDEDKKKFDVRCRKCGSTDCEFENSIAYHDSCVTGDISLTCKKCGESEEVYAPRY